MNHKTVTEIKAKYKELISCLDKNGSNYMAEVNKLVQDCKEELHAKYDALIGEVNEAAKDFVFVYDLEAVVGEELQDMRDLCVFDTSFDAEPNYELSKYLTNE